MKTDKLIKRIFELLFGITLVSFGIAFSIKANLGTSPVSSLPYVLSQLLNSTTGIMTICVHIVFVIFQVLILRKDYKIINLLQIPLGVFMGTIVDLAVKVLSFVTYSNYLQQVLLCIVGIILVGIGVAFEVEADIMVLAVEGFALAVAEKKNKKFGDMKMFTDISIVATATILSLLFFKKLSGVREGTIAAAILVGQIAKLFKKYVLTAKFQFD